MEFYQTWYWWANLLLDNTTLSTYYFPYLPSPLSPPSLALMVNININGWTWSADNCQRASWDYNYKFLQGPRFHFLWVVYSHQKVGNWTNDARRWSKQLLVKIRANSFISYLRFMHSSYKNIFIISGLIDSTPTFAFSRESTLE